MEHMRELGKDGCNGSEGLFGTKSSRNCCRDSRVEGLATAEVGMGSILERQSPATRKRLKRKNWDKREWVTVGPLSGNDGVVCFNCWRGEWSRAGSGLGLCAFDFSSTSLQLSGLRKVIHPLRALVFSAVKWRRGCLGRNGVDGMVHIKCFRQDVVSSGCN